MLALKRLLPTEKMALFIPLATAVVGFVAKVAILFLFCFFLPSTFHLVTHRTKWVWVGLGGEGGKACVRDKDYLSPSSERWLWA